MSQNQCIEQVEAQQLKKRVSFKIGDTIKVHTKIIEGEKERTQIFTGVVIARKKGGLSETFSVYRNAYGCNMERVFLLHSPRISKLEVIRSGKVRRSKLYYLRGESGKKAKLKEKIGLKEEASPVEVETSIHMKEEKPIEKEAKATKKTSKKEQKELSLKKEKKSDKSKKEKE